jgi:heat shock protein HslJ
MFKASIMIVIIISIFFACSSADITKDLQGSEWELTSINAKVLNKSELMNGLPTITFGEGGVLSGSTSCNRFNGSYKIEGANISMQPGAMTKMFCPGSTEQDFLNAMSRINGYKLENEKLFLLDGSMITMELIQKEK